MIHSMAADKESSEYYIHEQYHIFAFMYDIKHFIGIVQRLIKAFQLSAFAIKGFAFSS